MLALGTNVYWENKNHIFYGTVVDGYAFKTKKYQDHHESAVLVRQANGAYILKTENELKIVTEYETRKRKF